MTAALLLPTSVTSALISAQYGLDLEVLPTGVRFAGVTLDDAQLDALWKLAVTRDKTVRVKLKSARGVPSARSTIVMDRAKAFGLVNVTLATEAGSGSAQGSTAPASGSDAGGSPRPRTPATGSGSGSATASGSATSGSATSNNANAPGPGTVRTGSGSGTKP